MLNARVVTLTGAGGNKSDAVRDSQNILEALMAERGITVCPVDLGTWGLKDTGRILKAITAQQPDAILMQYPTAAFGASFGPLAIVGLQRIAPVVVMLHEFVAAHPLRKLAIGGLTVRADLVATAADRETAALGRMFPWLRGRFRRVPISSNIPGREWAPTQPPKVVYFGQIRPEKGLEAFLECRDQIAASRPDVQFEVVGATVPRFADFAATFTKSAQERGIAILGGLESDAVTEWLATATVALLPFPDGASFRRGSLFAAAACGVPLATTTGADTPPALEAQIDRATTAAELTALTLRYLNDEQARMQAHRQSVALSSKFGWDDTIDRYVDVLSEAIAKRGRRAAGSKQAGLAVAATRTAG